MTSWEQYIPTKERRNRGTSYGEGENFYAAFMDLAENLQGWGGNKAWHYRGEKGGGG